jgi:5-methylcytosine-specific restriction endonuclease McrA
VKRTRIRPISDKKRRQLVANARVRAAVFARDGYRCQIAKIPDAGPCFGELTYHHILKASQGGAYTLDNGLTACSFHNDMVEDRPDWAHANGLVTRRGDAA